MAAGWIEGDVTFHAAVRQPAELPQQVGVVPSRALSFQDRAEAERLRAAFEGGGRAVLCQVLTGMGGAGKTQLAADFAHRAWDEHQVEVLVWVTAVSRTAIVSAYAQAGEELCGADPSDPERAAQVFLAWLRAKQHRWLVVLDDVADPDDLRGLWPPAGPHGRILITTRRRDAALAREGHRLIEVGLFTRAEAVAYLTRALAIHDREEREEQLAALASDLGRVPLALAQAAAYLIDSGEDTAAYRRLLTDRAATLADIAPDRLPDEQALPLAATWSLSLDRADALRPAGLARPMLQLAALLDPNGIPQGVLTSAPALAHLTAYRTRAGHHPTGEPAPVSVQHAVRALRALHRLSLVDHIPDTPHQAVRIHQLIQRTTRDTLTPHQHARLARIAADALTAAWPEIERDTALAQALRANTTALTIRAEHALYRPYPHPVLYRTGMSLGEAGQVTAARDLYQHLTDSTGSYLGPNHPATLAARSGLAQWRGEAGDTAGAATAYAELLQDQMRVLGPDHPDTLTTRSEVARWRGEAGDAVGAAVAFGELLPDMVRVLGADHSYTLTVRNNLAFWRGEAGDAAGAAAAFGELLQDQMRVLGADHRHTLRSRTNLARWRGEAGDAAGAATGYAELLPDMVRVLGPDHPGTLAARNNLAFWRGEAGDAAGAATAYAELLEDRLRVLGPDDPATLAARNDLAVWRGEAGNAAGAATAAAELLDDRLRVLGPDHPDTLTTRSEVARWRGEAGDAVGAAAAFGELLPDMVRVLGADHSYTLTVRNNLAFWRGGGGRCARGCRGIR
ncbi:FxSxx-COOH system tetratricopeptide repeat protein [Actinacidiphila epipremni]|uniref:FxSxx-COOH system tetratricopeptide repeat protein n=1 Tax=Actinacidiphila epipremni TaxID=2053013 RepID=UPI001F0FB1E9|nr:FxSxx-COOH system tetratricopeptide repeat protein [Actinacidiphila epipremni]